MKSKRLIAILGVLGFLVVLIVMSSTLFTLQSISVNWLTSKYRLENVDDYQIVKDVEKGQSIFLLKKDDISSKLEKSFPYLRVVSIETKFPNKIVIHTAERESLYAIKLSDSEYAVIDEKGKVLTLTDGSIFEGSEADLGTRPILVNFENMALDVKDYVEGEDIKNTYIKNLLSDLSLSFRESRYSPTTCKGVMKSIDIESEGKKSEVNIQTRNGMVLKIHEIEEYTTDKLLLGFERYNYYHTQGIVDCTIEVWYCAETSSIVADVQW